MIFIYKSHIQILQSASRLRSSDVLTLAHFPAHWAKLSWGTVVVVVVSGGKERGKNEKEVRRKKEKKRKKGKKGKERQSATCVLILAHVPGHWAIGEGGGGFQHRGQLFIPPIEGVLSSFMGAHLHYFNPSTFNICTYG